MVPVGHTDHSQPAGRSARYESLGQGAAGSPRGTPRNSPREHSVPRMPAAEPPLSYPQRPARPHGESIDLGNGDDAAGYLSDGTSAHSRKRLHQANGLSASAPATPGVHPHARAHFDESASRSPSQEREKQYPTGKGAAGGGGYPAPPPLSRQSTGLSWVNATATDRKHPYGQLPSASRSDPNFLTFAESEAPKSRFARGWLMLLSTNIVFRWTTYILPFLALLWIPGIIGETAAKDATVWSVRLLWWSIWLTVVWLGWWGAVAASKIAPGLLNATVGVVAPELRHYILYISNVQRWLALWGWSLAIWISFNPLILSHGPSNDSQGDGHTLHQIIQGLFGIFISCCLLLLEKVVVQMIARNFHKKSYADRIQTQKAQIRTLTQLYLYSHDIGRSDTLDHAFQQVDAAKVLKRALKGARNVAKAGATALGTVASEIAGERVLQPNSPMSMVTAALQSANKSRQLARRIFFSYRPSGAEAIMPSDIVHCFATQEEAVEAFQLFDQDGNGDISLDELEMAVLEVHRERLALASSMRDVDSAVDRLNQILMVVWYIAAILIIVSLLNVGFSTLITGAGTFVLGLSWLIGTTAQEVLASCIFLFVKHPYDVSDRIDVDGVGYVITEMHLLYTVMRQLDGKIVQMPHTLLNTKAVTNIRRSGAITENYKWDVAIETTFDQIEALREDMLAFLEHESRDFQPKMDIAVVDFEGQGKLTLGADICYKSNWQNGTLKAQRRNKWLIALKESMFKHSIWGPKDAGNPHPDPADPTVVKLMRDSEAAPAYEQPRGAQTASPPAVPADRNDSVRSPISPTSPSDRIPTSPAQVARGLSSRHAVIEDASADVFRRGNGRRASLDVGSPRMQSMLAPEVGLSPGLAPPLLSVTSEVPTAPVPSTSRGETRSGTAAHAPSETIEMRQRRMT